MQITRLAGLLHDVVAWALKGTLLDIVYVLVSMGLVSLLSAMGVAYVALVAEEFDKPSD